MSVDLTKLSLYTNRPAFKNNNLFTGSFNISGTIGGGVNTRSVTLDLGFSPDIADILVGQSGEYSKEWSITVNPVVVSGNGSISGSINTLWSIGARISGSSLIITAFNIHTVDETITLSSETVNVRVIDYSGIGVSDKLAFDSRVNYMKRGSEASGLVGSHTMTLGGSGSTSTHTITHGLGYLPFFVVGYNINNTSIIWSTNRVWEYSDSASTDPDRPVQTWHRCNTNRLEINLVNGNGSGQQSGSRTVWWVIYLDYES